MLGHAMDKPDRQQQNQYNKAHTPEVIEHFGAACSFCRQQVPQLSQAQLDWSSKDCDDIAHTIYNYGQGYFM